MDQVPVAATPAATPAATIEAVRSAYQEEIDPLDKMHAQDIQRCRDEMSAKLENFETLCKDLARSQAENGRLRAQHDSLEAVVVAHQQKVGTIMREICLQSTDQHADSLKDIISKVEAIVDKFDETVRAGQGKIFNMLLEEIKVSASLRGEILDFERRLKAAERQAMLEEGRAKSAEENYIQYLDRYLTCLREGSANEVKAKDHDRITTELRSLQEYVKDYEKQLGELRKAEGALRKHICDVESSKITLADGNAGLKEAETRLQKEKVRLNAQLAECHERDKALQKENTRLRAQLEECLERQRASSVVTAVVPQSASQPSVATTAIQRTSETQGSQGRVRNTMRSIVNATHCFGDVMSRKVFGREYFTPSDTADLHDDVKK